MTNAATLRSDLLDLLQPGAGCLGTPGLAVLSLTGRPVRCVAPEPPRGAAPSPQAVVASVDAALDRLGGAAPRWVLIGADVDPLTAGATWSEAALAAARRLVRRGVAVRLATRGAPHLSDAWGALLADAARGPGATLEVALFTLDAHVSALYEPKAALPAERLQAARRLHAEGVPVEARIHPLLPWISDTAAHLEPLVDALARAGVRRLSASYIHVDRKGSRRLRGLPPAHRALLRGCMGGFPRRDGEARLLPASLRREGYARLQRIAAAAGIQAVACAEANPDLHAAQGCVTLPPERQAGRPAPAPEPPRPEPQRVLRLPYAQAAAARTSRPRPTGVRQLALFGEVTAG